MECMSKLGCPNWLFDPIKMRTVNTLDKVFARRDINQDEEIFNSYIDTEMPFDTRQELLQGQYEFICDCQKCLQRI